MPLEPQVTFETFEKWGMDFVGPINPPSKQKSYIIVCTDNLTKWEETKAIKAEKKEKVVDFLRENIFYKFGYPRELVTDQGSQFTSNLIEDLLTHHKIKHRTSTPYHPQANGQVEVTNRALEGILTKVVRNNRKDWADRLVKATWAYNTTWKTTTGDWALLYDSRYKDFKGKLRTRSLGPYTMEKCNDNGSVLIRTIDEEAIPKLVNGHRLKIYKKPLSRQEFIETVEKSVLVVEQGSTSIPATP
eukprot:PITA_26374